MTYLLDTNVVSELRKRPEIIDPHVRAWADGCRPDTSFISVISLMEIEIGVARKERADPAQGRILREWLDSRVLAEFAGRILPVSPEIARMAAHLHVPDSRPMADAFLAATAHVHGLTLVTRNTKDVADTGVRLLNPWDSPR